MSEFEFLFTGVSIVIALAVARLLEGLRDSFDPTRRFWIHYLWVITRLMAALNVFWSAFDDLGRTDNDFVLFASLITPPAVLFLQANALLTAHPGTVRDWASHFWSVRRWFFGSNVILVLASSFTYTYSGASGFPYAMMGIGLALSVAGYVSSNMRVHGVLVVMALANSAASLVRVAFEA